MAIERSLHADVRCMGERHATASLHGFPYNEAVVHHGFIQRSRSCNEANERPYVEWCIFLQSPMDVSLSFANTSTSFFIW